MNNSKKILLPDQMKAIARYEISFTEVIPLPNDYDEIEDFIEVPEKYQFTLDDLYTALKNLIEKDPAVEEFNKNWFYPVSQLEEAFGIDAACGEDVYVDFEEDVATNCVRGLPVTQEDIFALVWSEIEYCWYGGDDEGRISDMPEFKDHLQTIEKYYSECSKPISERTFTERQKKRIYRKF